MDWVLITIGTCLVLFCVVQTMFWTSQSLTRLWAEQNYWHLQRQLLRDKLAAVRNGSAATTNDLIQPSVAAGLGQVGQPAAVVDQAKRTAATEPAWQGWRTFRIQRKIQEAAQTTSVYLVPQDGFPLPSFRPGQYLTLRFQLPNGPKPAVRCYSLSSAPDSSHYRITVKNIHRSVPSSGGVSHFVNQDSSVGDLVEAKAPSGDFVWESQPAGPVIFLAGGVGITPLLSMIESALQEAQPTEMLLVYGVRNRSEHLFQERLSELARQHSNFQQLICYSQPGDLDVQGRDYHIRGRISIDLIRRVVPSPRFHFYLCGPGAFMTDLHRPLLEWGVPESQLRFEAFGPATIPTQRGLAIEPSLEQSCEASAPWVVQVRFAKSQQIRPSRHAGETLLETGLAAGLALDYGCRAGQCGECRVRLLQGQVSYPNGRPTDLGAGDCLPCIAVPDPASPLNQEIILDA